MSDTIFAPASGAGRAAVAIVRVSGPMTSRVVETVCGGPLAPRVASLRTLKSATGETLDQALVLWLPAPHSFTGEDSAEFQVHGSRAVVSALLRRLGEFPACRLAEPGEFARRAFLNGKMDLAAVEGLGDLIDSETEGQRRQALRQLDGHLGRQAEIWRTALLESLALLEAEIDFADEDDVGGFDAAALRSRIAALLEGLETALSGAASGEKLREGFVVVLAGPPNAGKSSLLNALARRDAAIVSSVPGTTRDPVEVALDLGGLPVTLVDTAGLRESADAIEQEGIRRALHKAERADLIIWLSEDGSEPDPALNPGSILEVQSKIDRGTLGGRPRLAHGVSTRTGEGIAELLETIRLRADAALSGGEQALVVRERHRVLVESARYALLRAVSLIDQGCPAVELIAEEVRSGAQCLGRISGRIDVEEVLGEIFSRFCIGK